MLSSTRSSCRVKASAAVVQGGRGDALHGEDARAEPARQRQLAVHHRASGTRRHHAQVSDEASELLVTVANVLLSCGILCSQSTQHEELQALHARRPTSLYLIALQLSSLTQAIILRDGAGAPKAALDGAAAAALDAFHTCPSLDLLVPALVEGGIEEMRRRCSLTPGEHLASCQRPQPWSCSGSTPRRLLDFCV